MQLVEPIVRTPSIASRTALRPGSGAPDRSSRRRLVSRSSPLDQRATSAAPSRPISGSIQLRDELLDREIFYLLKEAEVLIERWRCHYNTAKPQCPWLPATCTGSDLAATKWTRLRCHPARPAGCAGTLPIPMDLRSGSGHL